MNQPATADTTTRPGDTTLGTYLRIRDRHTTLRDLIHEEELVETISRDQPLTEAAADLGITVDELTDRIAAATPDERATIEWRLAGGVIE